MSSTSFGGKARLAARDETTWRTRATFSARAGRVRRMSLSWALARRAASRVYEAGPPWPELGDPLPPTRSAGRVSMMLVANLPMLKPALTRAGRSFPDHVSTGTTYHPIDMD